MTKFRLLLLAILLLVWTAQASAQFAHKSARDEDWYCGGQYGKSTELKTGECPIRPRGAAAVDLRVAPTSQQSYGCS